MKKATKNNLLKRFVRFGIVGGIGAVVNTIILYLLTQAGMYYVIASVIATEVAIISNFLGNNYFTFRERKGGSMTRKFLVFQGISMLSLLCTVTVLWILTTVFGERLLLAWNLLAIFAASLLNFTLNLKFTWKKPHAKKQVLQAAVYRTGGSCYAL